MSPGGAWLRWECLQVGRGRPSTSIMCFPNESFTKDSRKELENTRPPLPPLRHWWWQREGGSCLTLLPELALHGAGDVSYCLPGAHQIPGSRAIIYTLKLFHHSSEYFKKTVTLSAVLSSYIRPTLRPFPHW